MVDQITTEFNAMDADQSAGGFETFTNNWGQYVKARG
jgi:hypothetical protein